MKNGIEKTAMIIGIIMMFITFIFLTIELVDRVRSGEASLEKMIKKSIGDDEQFVFSKMIQDGRSVALIDYNCVPINKITKGIMDCNGE
ncbi:hypothetical protein J4460_03330 [Candidatus Woesearchaeota archaeon]|nr:MAG: hypothetical protein QS99_C0008G0037 [archaeon GW2011_AR4]MBS3129680.1 hypothetical protein [Candidatus Woesearchaeota archaeon]HIH38784.1 hypothetical protein [Candidatus Woesearchaeota archaeon]HIH49200.1 hypothetical protein [Candidatus Woesearchaeota archaeon]HIJ03342.1 hypothetical protein [Candidatus Woesearchaeota archaeon]